MIVDRNRWSSKASFFSSILSHHLVYTSRLGKYPPLATSTSVNHCSLLFNTVTMSKYGYGVLLCSVIGQQNSRHFFNQWKANTKPIATCTRAFSRALRRLHVIASNSDWLMALFWPVVIGLSNCFGSLFLRHSIKKRSILQNTYARESEGKMELFPFFSCNKQSKLLFVMNCYQYVE